ncbi:hypothetical protein JW964_06745 [candidate division KSB1 bacterium]|nr:hypothetical protein [candidate division KSB1 bacterium]
MNCYQAKIYKHALTTESPKTYFIGDQVELLRTKMILSPEKGPYVEINLKNGQKEDGKLIQILEKNIELNTGYYLKSKNGSLIRVEKNISIPKNEVLLMKVY